MLLLNRTLLRLAKGLWGWIAAILVVKLVTLAGTTAFAKVVARFLGNMFSPDMTLDAAGPAVFAALLTALLTLAAELLRGEMEFRCTAKARTTLRKAFFEKVLELDAGNIERIGPVSAVTASVDGVESMQVYYSQYLPGLAYCFCAPVYLFFQLRDASLPVAIFLFVVSFLLMPINNVFRTHIEGLKGKYWEAVEDLTGTYLESVQGLTTLKLFRRDEERMQVLKAKADTFNKRTMDVMKVNFLSFLVTDGVIYGSVLAATAMACVPVFKGGMDFSQALMVLMLSYSFFASVRQLMNATHSALAGVSAAEQADALLSIDTSRPYDPTLPRDAIPFTGIKMEGVSHSYKGRNAALDDITLTVPKGKVVALAGLSGCGKSTVAGLLMRFFDPGSGKITLEGRDYTSFTPEELRRHIIMVPQSVSIFSGTIAFNLRIAKQDATDEELMRVLEQVRLKDWILAQPDGLETDVGDSGSKLSGGQRQKIGIARALLCEAEYIIFDEATSSVDVVSEQEIWNCIDRLALTRTLIIISHRLSTIKNADCIYLLSGGRIVESGDHEALLAQHGLYHKLVTEQAQLDVEGGAAK